MALALLNSTVIGTLFLRQKGWVYFWFLDFSRYLKFKDFSVSVLLSAHFERLRCLLYGGFFNMLHHMYKQLLQLLWVFLFCVWHVLVSCPCDTKVSLSSFSCCLFEDTKLSLSSSSFDSWAGRKLPLTVQHFSHKTDRHCKTVYYTKLHSNKLHYTVIHKKK